MVKTETIIVENGKTRPLKTTGKWFRLRTLTAAAAPIGTILSLRVKAMQQGNNGNFIADNALMYEGDRLQWDDKKFEQLDFSNTTGYDITVEVRSSDEGTDDTTHVKIDNFPDVGGSDLVPYTDVVLPATGVVTLILAANPNRRSVTIGARHDWDPATWARIGNATVGATKGAELGVQGEVIVDNKGAIYGKNTGAVDVNVTIVELIN